MNTIIVPVDFSAASTTALRVAAGIAHDAGMSLTIIHVFNPFIPCGRARTSEEVRADRDGLAQQLHAYTRQSMATLHFHPPIKTVVAEGVPPTYIQQRSKDDNVALIVMGANTGGSRMQQNALGHMAWALTDGGGCPIVLIPRDFDEHVRGSRAKIFSSLIAVAGKPSRINA